MMIMGIIDLNTIKDALKIAGKIDLYPQILEMQEKLLEQQGKISELKDENEKIKKDLQIKNSLFIENDAYWIEKESGKDGPFCTRCYDVNKNLVRMQLSHSSSSFHLCPECKSSFQTNPGFRPPYRSMMPPEDYR
jgi:hypothetical protein